MFPLGVASDYFRTHHRRSTKTLFTLGKEGQAAYRPKESKLTEQEKIEIRNRLRAEERVNWKKVIGLGVLSIVLSYAALSLVSSMFLGYWTIF